MYNCGNCSAEFDDTSDGLIVHHRGHVATAICPACTDGTRVVKVVLRRGPADQFKYDQFSALEMKARAFGK